MVSKSTQPKLLRFHLCRTCYRYKNKHFMVSKNRLVIVPRNNPPETVKNRALNRNHLNIITFCMISDSIYLYILHTVTLIFGISNVSVMSCYVYIYSPLGQLSSLREPIMTSFVYVCLCERGQYRR